MYYSGAPQNNRADPDPCEEIGSALRDHPSRNGRAFKTARRPGKARPQMARKHRSDWTDVKAALARMLTDTLPVEPSYDEVQQADLTRQMELDRKRWPDLYKYLDQGRWPPDLYRHLEQDDNEWGRGE